MKKLLLPLAAAALLVALAVFASSADIPKINSRGESVQYERATVLRVISEVLEPDEVTGELVGTQELEIRYTSGVASGGRSTLTNYVTRLNRLRAKAGTQIIVNTTQNGSMISSAGVYTANRTLGVVIFAAIFAGVLVAIGGKRGLKSLIGLLLTILCILFILIPLLYLGVSPALAALLVAAISSAITLTLVSGFSPKTLAAIATTIVCSSLAGVFSLLGSALMNVGDYYLPDAEELVAAANASSLNLRGIFFAAVLISSLGAVMDIAMSIASALAEIKEKSPDLSARELMKSGMNIGRDTMGTMSNTLILAFAGGYLTYLVTLYTYDVSLTEVFSFPSVCTELVSGMAGCIGLFLAVPVASALSAKLLTRRERVS